MRHGQDKHRKCKYYSRVFYLICCTPNPQEMVNIFSALELFLYKKEKKQNMEVFVVYISHHILTLDFNFDVRSFKKMEILSFCNLKTVLIAFFKMYNLS